MSIFRFLHAADIHLDSPLRGLSRYEGLPADRLRRATRDAFDNLIQAALTEAVDFVVIAGDLFDGEWKDMATGLYFARAMGRLAEAAVPVFLLKGNHDAESAITKSLPLPHTVKVFSSRKTETFQLPDIDVALHGRSFPTAHVHENFAEAYPAPVSGAFNIGVLHTAIGGYAQHEPYAPCTIQGLIAKGYDYWALGHVHERNELSREPWIVFPGNIQGRDVRETGVKGATLVEVDHGHIASVRHLPLDVVRWLRVEVDCTGVTTIEDTQSRVREALTRAWSASEDRATVARVMLMGTTPIAGAIGDRRGLLRDEIRALAAQTGGDLWIEKVQIAITPPAATHAIPSGDMAALLEGALQSPELQTLLADELKAFLDAMPVEVGAESAILTIAREKRWTDLLAMASEALRERLSTGAA